MEVVKEELLHCSICMELFTDPRGLPCQHTFCRHCLTTFINARTDRLTCTSFDCPLCRRSTTLETIFADGSSFPKNLIITSLLDIHKSLDGEHTAVVRDNMLHMSHHKVDTKNSFTQTDIKQCKESAAQTISRSRRNQVSQTNSTLVTSTGVQAKVKITNRQREAQTDMVTDMVDNPNVLERRKEATPSEASQSENGIFKRMCLYLISVCNRLQRDLIVRLLISCIVDFCTNPFKENRLKRLKWKLIVLPLMRLYCSICFGFVLFLHVIAELSIDFLLLCLMCTVFHLVMTTDFRCVSFQTL